MESKYFCYTRASERTTAVRLGSSNEDATMLRLYSSNAVGGVGGDCRIAFDGAGRLAATDASSNAFFTASPAGIAFCASGVTTPRHALDVSGSLNLGPSDIVRHRDGFAYDFDVWSNAAHGARYDGRVLVGLGLGAGAGADLDVTGSLNCGALDLHGAPFPLSEWATFSSHAAVTTTSNVGIGVPLPLFALDVSGDINYSGNLLKNGYVARFSQWLRAPAIGTLINTPVVVGEAGVAGGGGALSALNVIGDARVTGAVRSATFGDGGGETWIQGGAAQPCAYDAGWTAWAGGSVASSFVAIGTRVTVLVSVTFSAPSAGTAFSFALPAGLPVRSGGLGTVAGTYGPADAPIAGSCWVDAAGRIVPAAAFAGPVSFAEGEISGLTSAVRVFDAACRWSPGNAFSLCLSYESGLAPVFLPPTGSAEANTQNAAGTLFHNGAVMAVPSIVPSSWSSVQLAILDAAGALLGTAPARLCAVGDFACLTLGSGAATLPAASTWRIRLPAEALGAADGTGDGAVLGDFCRGAALVGACVLANRGTECRCVGPAAAASGEFSACLIVARPSGVGVGVAPSFLARDASGNVRVNPTRHTASASSLAWHAYAWAPEGTGVTDVTAQWLQIGFCVTVHVRCAWAGGAGATWTAPLPLPAPAEDAACMDAAVLDLGLGLGVIELVDGATFRIGGFEGGAPPLGARLTARLTYGARAVRVAHESATALAAGPAGGLRVGGGGGGLDDAPGNLDVSGGMAVGGDGGFRTTRDGTSAPSLAGGTLHVLPSGRVVMDSLAVASTPVTTDALLLAGDASLVAGGGVSDIEGLSAPHLRLRSLTATAAIVVSDTARAASLGEARGDMAASRGLRAGNVAVVGALACDRASASNLIARDLVATDAVVAGTLRASVVAALGAPFAGDGSGLSNLPGEFASTTYAVVSVRDIDALAVGPRAVGLGVAAPSAALDVSGAVLAAEAVAGIVDVAPGDGGYDRSVAPDRGWWKTRAAFGFSQEVAPGPTPSGGALVLGNGTLLLYGPEGVMRWGRDVAATPLPGAMAGSPVSAVVLNDGRAWILQTEYGAAGSVGELACAIVGADGVPSARRYPLDPPTARVGRHGLAVAADGRVVVAASHAAYAYDPVADAVVAVAGCEGPHGGAVALADGRVMLLPYQGERTALPGGETVLAAASSLRLQPAGIAMQDGAVVRLEPGAELVARSGAADCRSAFYAGGAVAPGAKSPVGFFGTPARSACLPDGTVLSLPASSNVLIRWDAAGAPRADAPVLLADGGSEPYAPQSLTDAPDATVVALTGSSTGYMQWYGGAGERVPLPWHAGAGLGTGGVARLLPDGRIAVPGAAGVSFVDTGERVPLSRCLHPMFR